MDILIERINNMGLVVEKKRIIKLPKGGMVLTIGDKQFFVNSDKNQIIERKENKKITSENSQENIDCLGEIVNKENKIPIIDNENIELI